MYNHAGLYALTLCCLCYCCTVLQPLGREARLLRYKQKKKHLRFEKTIRYASRKAYAESRPRYKGRFIKQQADEYSKAAGVNRNGKRSQAVVPAATTTAATRSIG